MHIMTKDGWKQLSPANCVEASPIAASNGVQPPYIGLLPSKTLCEFVNRIKDNEMKYFDDGIRMVYGKPDKRIEVDNATPIHLISNPPMGF